MEFGVLGPLRLAVDGREVALRTQRERALLAFLLLHAGEVISTDRLLDEIWGERPPRTAKRSLHNYVSRLRKVFGTEMLRTRPPGYVLDVEPDAVDATHFVRLLEGSRGAPAAERAETLQQALALWRGRALSDLEDEPFALQEAMRLNELRASAEEELVAAELELGKHEQLVARLEQLVAANPLRERLHGQLMLALYRSGRRGDALAVYQSARLTLVEELGIEPGPSLRALEAAILRQDPTLDAPSVETSSAVDLRERRTTATVLFAELEVEAESDPGRYLASTAQALHELRAATEYHGGTVERLAGDELVAVFGVPARHEDDALRAVRAALQIAGSATTDVRVALDTGELITPAAGSRSPVVGAPLMAAKRLAVAAPPGVVVATSTTHALVREAVDAEPIGPLDVRARSGPVAAVRITSVVEERAARRVADTPLVGRRVELAQLRTVYDTAVSTGRSAVFGVFGEAGLGKTRLARELAQQIRDEADLLVGRCVAYGEGATWRPLRELIRSSGSDLTELLAGTRNGTRAARILESIVDASDTDASVDDAFWAARRFLEASARRRPLLVVVDDVHWAEPAFLDFVEQIASTPTQAPILLLVLARPELAAERPALQSLQLRPLTDEDVLRLVDSSAPESVPRDVRERIPDVAEGNPLFAEQLVAYAAEHGSAALTSVPPTVEALLAARLDRLDPQGRAVLQRAAVVGRDFWQTAVLHLTPDLEVPAVGRHLMQLAEKGLIHRASTNGARKDAFRFHHVLIRDVAYGAIPKVERSKLHEVVADWLETTTDGDDELIGYHLEQAAHYKLELGQRDLVLEERAGERLAAAGLRASWRVDTRAAVALLERALTLLRPLRLDVRLELELAGATPDLVRTAAMNEAVAERAREAGDRVGEALAQLAIAHDRAYLSEQGSVEELEAVARRVLPVFEQAEDHAVLVFAWRALVTVANSRGRFGDCVQASQRAIQHSRLAGEHRSSLFGLHYSLVAGPWPADEALSILDRALPENAHPSVFLSRAELLAMLGRFEEAIAIVADEGERLRELTQSDGGELELATIARYTGDHERAAAQLRSWCAFLEDRHTFGALSTYLPLLGRSLCAIGRHQEAEALARRSRELGDAQDAYTQMLWRQVQALVDAARGDHGEAELLAREAVAIGERTDALNWQGDAYCDLAEVLHAAGRTDESVAALEAALERYEQKKNLAMVVPVRKRLTTVRRRPLVRSSG